MNPIILKPQEGPQERFLATSADICIFGGSAGGGKAAPLSEPVLTPFGFRKMGDIKVGDLVIGANGKAERVIQIHPQGEMDVYRIKFIDGAETRCTAQHLWLSKEAHKSSQRDTRGLGNWRVRDTKTLIEMLKKGKNMLIPMTKPVTYTVGRYGGKIKPYTFGVLLGDGCLSGSSITVTKNDDEIFENVSRDGYDIAPVKTQNNVKTYIFHNFKEERRYLSLHKLRCTAKGKYIPDGYKYAPPEYRLALIQGLMDTDGYADSRGHCEYCTISPRLAKDVQELIWSIGGKATVREKIPTCTFPDGTKKTCDKAYTVYIQTGNNAQLFRLKRKKNRCQGKKFNGGYSEMLRRIISIEPCGKEVCQCITVDSPDGLYVTKDYIVTHNSFALLLEPLRYMDVEGYKAVVFRQNYTQIMAAGGLWDESSKMYRLLPNAVATMSPKAHWTFGGKAVINFDYLARDDDVYKWQGSQICALCCEVNTPVLMSDGTYKKVADIKVGDKVMTLKGVQTITHVGAEEEKDCVKVTDEHGNSQIQSTNHEFLTTAGWLSYDSVNKSISNYSNSVPFADKHSLFPGTAYKKNGGKSMGSKQIQQFLLQVADSHLSTLAQCECHKSYEARHALTCEQILYRFFHRYALLYELKFQLFEQSLAIHTYHQARKGEPSQSPLYHQSLLVNGEHKVLSNRGNEPEVSELLRRNVPPSVLYREILAFLRLHRRSCQSGKKGGAISCESPDAHFLSRPANFQGDCLICLDCDDEQFPYRASISQDGVLRIDGVVEQIPKCSLSDGEGNIENGIYRKLLYQHPYSHDKFLSEGCYSLCSLVVTPIGKKTVRAFTVSSQNNFITEMGIVNKNCFDELTHFSEKQFFYMLSRNRSTCGVKPYVRATCNPDADSWVAKFIAWWIDPETGYPIKERSGVKRYFTRVDDTVIWGDTAEECAEKSGVDISLCKSVTFIASSIHDNKALLAADPSYLASLNALSLVERERLLNGNWKIKPAAGLYFPRNGIRIVKTIPDKLVTSIRAWDLAATEITTSNKDPDRTCGTLWGRMRNGQYIILDGIRVAKNAANVRDLIVSTARQDKTMYGTSKIFIPQDPGQAGKDQSRSYAKILTGYSFMSNPVTGNKITRAEPMAAQWQNGNIYMLEGEWNKPYLDEMDGFPDLLHDDYVDSSSDGFRIVSNYSTWGGLTK